LLASNLSMQKPFWHTLALGILLALTLGAINEVSAYNGRPDLSNGVLDLREWDFETDGNLPLTGKWRFYWKEHLKPDSEFDTESPQAFSLIQVPGPWKGHDHKGKAVTGHGYATYGLKLLHTSQTMRLALKIPDLGTASRVYINGRLVFTSGFPGESAETTTPQLATGVVEFETRTNQTDIMMHISNFNYRSGAVWESLTLGHARGISKHREKELLLNFFLLGSIVIMGLFHISLHWTRKSDATSLYFGVFCLLIGIRYLSTGEHHIQQFLPGLNFEWLVRFIYISFYLGPPMFIMYAKALFPDDISQKVLTITQGVGVTFTLLVLVSPARIFSYTMPAFQLLTLLLFLYGIWCFAVTIKRKRDGARLFLLGFLVFMVTGINDILYSRWIIHTGNYVQFGVFIFLFSQTVLISRRFSKAFTLIERQSQELRTANAFHEEELRRRKKIQTQLKESEQRYRLIAENASDIIWILNLSSMTFDYASPSVERIRGYSLKEAMQLGLEDHVSQESYQRTLRILAEELARDEQPGVDKNRSRTIEIQQTTKGGGYIWTEATMSFIRNSDGKPVSVLGVSRDIEKRKQAEDKLVESEKKYRNLFENGSDLLCIHDLEGNLIETNIHYKKEYAWTRDDLANLNIRDVIPERYKKDFDQYLANILANGTDEGYLTAQTKMGEKVVLEYRNNLIYGPEGLPVAVQSAARDITQRYKTEKALTESEEKYKELFKNAPAGIYEFDMQEMRFLKVNDIMCAYSGYTEDEFLALDPYELMSEDSKPLLRVNFEKVYTNKLQEIAAEYKIKNKNKRDFWVLVNAKFFYEDGVPVRAMAVVHDLTEIREAQDEQKKLEIKLQHARKLESLGTLAGGVAHDLNNILGAIVSYPDLLLLDLDADSPLRPPLKAIKKSGLKAADIVQDLLTLARRGVEHRQVTDLNQIIHDFILSPEYKRMVLRRENVHVDVSLDTSILKVVGSDVHIAKALMNLVANAVDAMPVGGEIRLISRSCYFDTDYNGYEIIPEGEYTVLEVADSGIGISVSDMERIFEPFYTKKSMGHSGTGLGMSVVWGTVKDHGGYIDIKSEEGFGTTFALYFPASRSKTAIPATIHIDDYLGNGETILVVDDIKGQRELAKQMMQRLGYKVRSAASGEEALSMVQNTKYDLLILDMIMKPGMDGLETYQHILEICPHQKAIIASGYAENERVHKTLLLGAGSYIKKPFTLEGIGLAVRSELDRDSKSRH